MLTNSGERSSGLMIGNLSEEFNNKVKTTNIATETITMMILFLISEKENFMFTFFVIDWSIIE